MRMTRPNFEFFGFGWLIVANLIAVPLHYSGMFGSHTAFQTGSDNAVLFMIVRGLLYVPFAIIVSRRMDHVGRGTWVKVVAWISVVPTPGPPLVALIAAFFYPSSRSPTP